MESVNTVRLRGGELFGLRTRKPGKVISCRAGVLWLTQQGDSADYLIRAGEDFTVNRTGLVLISALAEAEFEISAEVGRLLLLQVFPAGVHTITVQARVLTDIDGSSATAKAAVGMGSTTIESVRMIKGENVIVDIE